MPDDKRAACMSAATLATGERQDRDIMCRSSTSRSVGDRKSSIITNDFRKVEIRRIL